MKLVLEKEFLLPVRWVETQSHDTAQNATFSAALLQTSGISRVALVTHAWHMRRAAAEFKKQGLIVAPAPMGFTPRGTTLFERLLPSTGALERCANVIREWVGGIVATAFSSK